MNFPTEAPLDKEAHDRPASGSGSPAADGAELVRLNQRKLGSDLKPHDDLIVCGSGSSGSVVARRRAENANASVLRLEAGGDDDVPRVTEAGLGPRNRGSERDWSFQGQPNPRLNGRSLAVSRGKVRGGGSSIHVMVWTRGPKTDGDFWASEAADPAWSSESVVNISRRLADWPDAPDPKDRGTGGPVCVEPAPDPNPIAPAMVEGARSVGIPTFAHPNGRLREGEGGASLVDGRAREGKRPSVFRSDPFPSLDRPHLTVLIHALVTRLTVEGKRATGVEFASDGKTPRVGAGLEVVLSLGAIPTP